MPTKRTRELEKLLAEIGTAGMVQLNYDMWDQHGREHASPEQRATMEADLAESTRAMTAAKAALAALVAKTRAEAPADVAAWADAHDAYLAAFLAETADDTAKSVATRERAAWAEVRAGSRAYVDEDLYYVTLDAARYRSLFGIDPQTREEVR